MTAPGAASVPRHRQTNGRHQVKQADGVVTRCASRVAKSGSQAHSFYIGADEFSVFTDDDLAPVAVGDRVSFEYEVRRYRTGSHREYFSVLSETLKIAAPAELEACVEGNVYIVSNPSMPGLLKVGFTTGAVAKRVSELSSVTGVPTGFKIEWSMPVVGNPRTVEQRAHAHLAPNKHGKEFFRVTLDNARAAVIHSFAELYPEQAACMDDAFAKRAQAEIDRRRRLAETSARKEEERLAEEAQEAFDRTLEGQWRKEGALEVVLVDFKEEPNRKHPSAFWLFGAKLDDYMEFKVEARQYGKEVVWRIFASGRISGEPVSDAHNLQSQREAMDQLTTAMKKLSVPNTRASISVPNALIANPPELPENYRNPKVTLAIGSLEGLVIRPAPVKARRRY